VIYNIFLFIESMGPTSPALLRWPYTSAAVTVVLARLPCSHFCVGPQPFSGAPVHTLYFTDDASDSVGVRAMPSTAAGLFYANFFTGAVA
jgi:hypothetical protein